MKMPLSKRVSELREGEDPAVPISAKPATIFDRLGGSPSTGSGHRLALRFKVRRPSWDHPGRLSFSPNSFPNRFSLPILVVSSG